MDPEPKFTWIHLPATNMVWMDDLVQRIMRDEDQDGSHFNQAKSFFKDSWIEVPDKASPSRIMRPRFVSCDAILRDTDYGAQTEDSGIVSKMQHDDGREIEGRKGSKGDQAEAKKLPEQKQKESQDEEATKASGVAATAIYEKLEESGKINYAEVLLEARKKYRKLFDEYDKEDEQNIHGSSTLDESYYHFGEDEDSTNDKIRRNESQVATDYWRKQQEKREEEKWEQDKQDKEEESYWLLIRVNQLWIWTINNKWLLSASSHPIDDVENELQNGILERLEKQGEAGGSDLQPGSAAEMSQLIVDYCIDFYERKPKARDGGRPENCTLTNFPSIRQTFSKSINSIVLAKAMDDKLGKTTIEAEKLSEKVKDILDELSILEATVHYQQDVQRAMRRQNIPKPMSKRDIQKAKIKQNDLETGITTTYIINDIKGMESVADRIHTAVNTTLSLQQSEVANLQAKLSIKHAELAAQQGRVLMVFTVVTILFVSYSGTLVSILVHPG
ncbi:hypothetical protein K4K60_002561 [Colletotrichum sp. SAR11_57]|nr:hypothetical protein K4K60_002561 [Colletotrichum sp. SAR11_57]